MFWGEKITEKIEKQYSEKIQVGKPIIIRDEKTASGRVHVGSLRGVAIHGIISELLTEKKIKNKYLFEINDYDPMDGLPIYLPEEKFKQYLGKPLCNIPSPDGKAKNYAEYFAEEFIGVIKEIGFEPEYYRSSEYYKNGKFNDFIREALDHAEDIRKIYKKISGSDRAESWLPINIICESCGNVSTTKPTTWDGKSVSYECVDLEWTKGCGHKGRIEPFDGKAKLPWKVEWAAKFKIFDVDVEGAGKDHTTKGGAREVAEEISRAIFKHRPPFNIPYEFLQIAGKKMSSSKGLGASSREIANILPPHLLRLLLIQKEPQRVIEFMPDGDTLPILFDTYDKFYADFVTGKDSDTAEIFRLCYGPKERGEIPKRLLPRFSEVAYLIQMPHINIEKEIEKDEGKILENEDKKELDERKKYAKIWLDSYAPEDYKFEIAKTLPESAKNFSDIQKLALAKVLEYIKSNSVLEGQALHTRLHEIKTEIKISPQDFFGALYTIFLGKQKGPKAGWFFSVMDRNFLIKRLEEAIA